ncbi:MAG: potassium channel family protein [Actinomycetota bacterium]|nr:potassium channel family protein [Actinomycetota bacterium]
MLLVVVGLTIVGLVMLDVLRTTVGVASGAGPLTGRLTHWLWALALRGGSHKVLRLGGLAVTLSVVIVWLAALWLGWSLIFLADPDAVVETTSGRRAGGWERVYFAGYTLFTLGNGEYAPKGTLWQLATILALTNGLGLVTLAITYLVPVTSAATHKRAVAAYIAGLGQRPDAILAHAWEGDRFARLENHLAPLTSMVALLAEQHLAYPVLHYFHSEDTYTASPPMLAGLDEALTVLLFGVDPAHRPAMLVLHPLRETMGHFLDTLYSAFIDPEPEPPPVPPLARLRDAGIPTVDDGEFEAAMEKLADRRRLLRALVHNDGWSWDDVWTVVSHGHDARTDGTA